MRGCAVDRIETDVTMVTMRNVDTRVETHMPLLRATEFGDEAFFLLSEGPVFIDLSL